MDSGSINLLLDAKNEYNKQLANILKAPILRVIKSVYNDAESLCHQENTTDNVLMVFQDNLSRIPKWESGRIRKEYETISKKEGGDWLDDLLKIIYITHIKILTIVSQAKKGAKIQIQAPTGTQFIHLVLIEVAREIWKCPYLCCNNVAKTEYQKNMREVESIIASCIDETIRKQLPVKKIVTEYLDPQLSTHQVDPPVNQVTSGILKKTTIKTEPIQETFKPVTIKSSSKNIVIPAQILPPPSKESHLENRGLTPKQSSLKNTKSLRELLKKGNETSPTIRNNSVTPVSINDELDFPEDLEEINVKKPSSQALEPDVTNPEPSINKLEASINKPEPEVTNPEPNINKPEPEVTNPEPSINKLEAEVTNPEPSINKPEPEVTNPEPEVTKEVIDTTKQETDINDQEASLSDLLEDVELEPVSIKQVIAPTNNISSNKTNGFTIDSLDNLDIEFDEPSVEDIDLRELQQSKKEVKTESISKKPGQFMFFNN